MSCRQERGRTGQDWVQVCAGSRHLQASHPYAGHMVLTQKPPARGCWATRAPPAARRLHRVATTLWPRGLSFRGASAALVWRQEVVFAGSTSSGRFLSLAVLWPDQLASPHAPSCKWSYSLSENFYCVFWVLTGRVSGELLLVSRQEQKAGGSRLCLTRWKGVPAPGGLGLRVWRDARGGAGPSRAAGWVSRAANVQRQVPEKCLSTKHGGTWAVGSTREHGGLTEQGRTGPGWAWGCLARVVWGSHGARPTGSFSALATLTAVPQGTSLTQGRRRGHGGARNLPLPHTCWALVPGAPPSQPASLLVYELILTTAVTVLGSVGPGSTVVT
ncbi:uncharacterized protein LOC111181311 isoform X2 [Delphinapterus leucas]|nr:uncharacterized protein LOC111181311 isoform X2 [Delphinapterus leucas]